MRTIYVIILFIMSLCTFAQDVDFTASASPNVLRVGEQFNLIYSSNQELENFDLPDIKDFELLGGPSQGHSQNFTSINGKVTSSSTYQYTYFFRAIKEGKYTIAPASIKYKNKIYRSNSVNIEVIKGNTQPSTNQSNSDNNSGKNNGVNDNDLFVRLILDKKEAYIGEQIMATVKIYTKTNLAGIDPGFKGPDFTGFFTEPVETPPLRSLKQEAIDNDIYGTGIIRRIMIIPQRTGEITINSFDLDVAVRREIRRRYSDPFFDDFSIPDVQEIPVKLTSKPVSVNVKALPSNAPASFKGAVGNFTVASSLSSSDAFTNEPQTLKITISGRGNLKLINELAVNLPEDFDKYDPVINLKLDNPLSGSKTFEYMIIPKVPGKYTIAPVEFTYFDAVAGQYKTLKTQSYSLNVEMGQGDTLITSSSGINKEDVRLLNQDIRFIKTKPPRLLVKDYFIGYSLWFYLTFVLLTVGFIGFIILRKRIIKSNSDIAGIRLKRADKYARKRLKKCQELLKQGNDSQFYEVMLNAIWKYISHKLNIPVSLLSKESIKNALVSRSVNDELIDRFLEIINQCEIARYSHSSMIISKDDLYKEALNVVTELQQKLK